ncbi:MAG: aminotransferase class V-fold PLP-dependent enzyme [Rhodopseudomonas palustris]|nr:aminotransferase class V-fold PLP-dependent enzyme [Rhodopseudomonas palustris]
MPPWQGGGDMIARRHLREDASTTAARTSSRPAPPNIADAVGLGAAIDYLSRIGIDAMRRA